MFVEGGDVDEVCGTHVWGARVYKSVPVYVKKWLRRLRECASVGVEVVLVVLVVVVVIVVVVVSVVLLDCMDVPL